jgi:large subunit ribosomal protein L25
LTREIQVEPISRRLLHVDFQQVAMTEKLTTSVPLVLQGTSSVVSRGEGIIIHGLEEVTIRVLPADLIPEIEVDLSALTQLHQALHVSDLKVSPAIEILTNPDEMIAKTVPVKEEVIVEAAPVAAAEVEIIGKGKKEEAVSAEGAAAPAAGGEKKPEGKKEKPEAKKEEKK